jgi:hypothetical protein
VHSTVEVLREIRTGEWPDDKSKHDFAFRQWLGMPLITQKSIKSGTFFVCWPVRRFSGREMRKVIGFHSHEKFSASWCDYPRTPTRVFGVVVTPSNESTSQCSIEILELCFVYGRSWRTIYAAMVNGPCQSSKAILVA